MTTKRTAKKPTNPAKMGKIIKKPAAKPKNPAKTKTKPVKSAADRIIDAMRELTQHLRNPHECLTLEAYNLLEPQHKVLFDRLMQAISKRTFGEQAE